MHCVLLQWAHMMVSYAESQWLTTSAESAAEDLCKIGVLDMVASLANVDIISIQQMLAVIVSNCIRTRMPRYYHRTTNICS